MSGDCSMKSTRGTLSLRSLPALLVARTPNDSKGSPVTHPNSYGSLVSAFSDISIHQLRKLIQSATTQRKPHQRLFHSINITMARTNRKGPADSGKGGRADRGKGQGGSGGGASSREVTISKAMSYVLRHAADKEGLKLDSNGYARVNELVGHLYKNIYFHHTIDLYTSLRVCSSSKSHAKVVV